MYTGNLEKSIAFGHFYFCTGVKANHIATCQPVTKNKMTLICVCRAQQRGRVPKRGNRSLQGTEHEVPRAVRLHLHCGELKKSPTGKPSDSHVSLKLNETGHVWQVFSRNPE